MSILIITAEQFKEAQANMQPSQHVNTTSLTFLQQPMMVKKERGSQEAGASNRAMMMIKKFLSLPPPTILTSKS
jgi:hypothetical protein